MIGCPYAFEKVVYVACPRKVHGIGGEPCEHCLERRPHPYAGRTCPGCGYLIGWQGQCYGCPRGVTR